METSVKIVVLIGIVALIALFAHKAFSEEIVDYRCVQACHARGEVLHNLCVSQCTYEI